MTRHHKTIRRYEVRYSQHRLSEAMPANIESPSDVAVLANSLIGDHVVETAIVFMIDARLKLLGYQEIARGSKTHVSFDPSDVLLPAILHSAVSVILAHNHPSNDPAPSHDDLLITWRLFEACAIVGIQLLDHLVVTQSNGYCSFADNSQLTTPPDHPLTRWKHV